MQVYTNYINEHINGNACTYAQTYSQNQEGIRMCTYTCAHTEVYTTSGKRVTIEQHCMNTHIDTYTPQFPSQLYKVTERPGAVQTSLKDTHTARS